MSILPLSSSSSSRWWPRSQASASTPKLPPQQPSSSFLASPSEIARSSSFQSIQAPPAMASAASPPPPRSAILRGNTSKFSAFANAIGFGSRSSKKQPLFDLQHSPLATDSYNDIPSQPPGSTFSNHIPDTYSTPRPSADPFSASPPSSAPIRTERRPSYQGALRTNGDADASVSCPNNTSSADPPLRPEFPRSKPEYDQSSRFGGILSSASSSNIDPGPMSVSPETGGALSFLRRRNDSAKASKTAAFTPPAAPLGDTKETRGSIRKDGRGSFQGHTRSQSSIDIQLPRLSRTSDDFASILEAVSGITAQLLETPVPPSTSTSSDRRRESGGRANFLQRAVAGRRSSNASDLGKTPSPQSTTSPTSPLSNGQSPPQPETRKLSARGRARTASAADSLQPSIFSTSSHSASILSQNQSLKRLVPSLPPTHSLPPTPKAPSTQRPSSSPTPGLLEPKARPKENGRPKTASGAATVLTIHTAASNRSLNAPHASHLSPITPSPTSMSLRLNVDGQTSHSGSTAPSPRVSTSVSETSSMSFAPPSQKSGSVDDGRPDSPIFGAVAMRKKPLDRRPSVVENGGKESEGTALRVPEASSSEKTPRASMEPLGMTTPKRTSNASVSMSGSASAGSSNQVLRKATSYSTLPFRPRADSSTSAPLTATATQSPRSSIWNIALPISNPASPRLEPTRLVRKQRSFHNVANFPIPPIPRHAPPLPDAGGSKSSESPSLTRILPLWSSNRRSTSRGRESPGQVKDDDSHSVRTLQNPSRKPSHERSKRPSESGGRTSPAISTFWDEPDSPMRPSFGTDPVASPSLKPKRPGEMLHKSSSDFGQYIIPPEELAAAWERKDKNVPLFATQSEEGLGGTCTPSGTKSLGPSTPPAKAPSRSVSFSAQSAISVRSADAATQSQPPSLPVGGVGLRPMPPRRPQSNSTGRIKTGSVLSDVATRGLHPLPPPPRNRPSLAATTIRSELSHKRFTNHSMTNSVAESGITSISAEMSVPKVSITASSDDQQHGPTRQRSILKKPSFLDIGPDDELDDDHTQGSGILQPGSRLSNPMANLDDPAVTEPQPFPAADSFLDLGRWSLEITQGSGDADSDTSIERSPDYHRWGR